MSSYAEVLVEKGLVSVEDIDSAQRLHEDKGLRLDKALIENEAITERAFLEVMAERFDFEFVDPVAERFRPRFPPHGRIVVDS